MKRCVPILMLAALAAAGCQKKADTAQPFATPGLTVNHPRAPLGSPLELTYRFRSSPRRSP